MITETTEADANQPCPFADPKFQMPLEEHCPVCGDKGRFPVEDDPRSTCPDMTGK